jgi:hypothetical protein
MPPVVWGVLSCSLVRLAALVSVCMLLQPPGCVCVWFERLTVSCRAFGVRVCLAHTTAGAMPHLHMKPHSSLRATLVCAQAVRWTPWQMCAA